MKLKKQAQQLMDKFDKEYAKKEKKNKPPVKCEARWTGYVKLVENHINEIGTREWIIDLSFTNALPTLNRNIKTTDFTFTDDKGIGYVKDHGESIIEGNRGSCTCTGEGEAELHEVGFESDTTYWISAIGPPCNRGGTGSDGGCASPSSDIVVPLQRLGANHKVLSGSETVVLNNPGGIKGTSTITMSWNLKRVCPPWKDTYTAKRIATLKEKVKEPVSQFIDKVNDELCIKLRVAQAFRTIAEQNELYAQGRTKPGKIVTNAKGGESNHNSGLAIDVYMVNCDGTIDLDNSVPPEVVKIAKEKGFEWGGDWKKFKDYPHFEMK